MSGIGAAARGVEKVEGVSPEAALKSVAPGPEADGVGATGLGPEWVFQLDHTDQRGRKWTGEFKAKVLTTRDRVTVGLTKARMANGIASAMLDPSTDSLLEVLAHLTVAIVAAPPWAEDLTAVYDQGVLGAIYAEVVSYEARFHGAEAANPG
jgi:hypothetical protein